MSYFDKYKKYKNKYLELKKQIGGDTPFITNPNLINLFTDPEMEQYLNPIYGLVLSESGYIINNYYLSDLLQTEESKLIKKIVKKIPGTFQPTNKLMELKPVDYGRYIAIKYLLMKGFISIINSQNGKGNKINVFNSVNDINKQDNDILNGYIKLLREFISWKNNNKINFDLLLYCVWWVTANNKGISEYYDGINEVFCIINKYLSYDKHLVYIDINKHSLTAFDSFEKIVLSITDKPFKIYNQEWPKNFCDKGQLTYPDCGEVTARNLINLICFNRNTFNVDILDSFGAIPQVIEYYRIFYNFEKQSSIEPEKIYGNCLNARDAWSKLIINYANTNINFIKSCSHKYEINEGLALDRTISNFSQLIKNLLPNIKNLNDIRTDLIENTDDKTIKETGIGNILISHKLFGNIIIHCDPGHYFMEYNTEEKTIEYTHLNLKQQQIIKILLKDEKLIDVNNYIWFNFNSELLVTMLNDSNTSTELKIKLFELSLTDHYDSDARRRIQINVNQDYFDDIVEKYGNNIKLNEYKYTSNNFDFVKKLPILKNLDSIIIISYSIISIDLTSLSQLQSIGNDFLPTHRQLKSIDLSSLTDIKTIGNNFLYGCSSLTSINLSGLTTLESIGDGFLSDCSSLKSIDLTPLLNITSIGNNFLNNCLSLTSIKLPHLSKVQSIGSYFLSSCSSLSSIDLSPLSKVQSIGNSFLSSCSSLSSIDLTPLCNLQSIGDNFLNQCSSLSTINMSDLSKLQIIGNNFFSCLDFPNCSSLLSINLSGLSKLQIIGNNFLSSCSRLKHIDIKGLSDVKTIGNNFLSSCSNLTSIDLTQLSCVQTIGKHFLSECSSLSSIDFSGLSGVQTIEDYFLSKCSRLKHINILSLSSIHTIGNFFLNKCSSLLSIDFSGLSGIQKIGFNFLYACSSLTSINLSGLSSIHTIGIGFLYRCSSLTSIDFSGLSGVKLIGNDFLNNCSSLTSIDFSGLSGVKLIGKNFLYECSSLTSINLTALSHLEIIGYNFMYNCSRLTSIDLSGLSHLEIIDSHFMNNCTRLININLSGLSAVKSVKSEFLTNCSSLEQIDISGLSDVQSIEDYFLCDCKNLKSIDLSGLSHLKIIGYGFMNDCSRLEQIDISGLSHIQSIEDNFLYNCKNLKSIKCTLKQQEILKATNFNLLKIEIFIV